MLLYLSSNENIGIFDFLSKEKGMIIKKLSGEFYLKKFVIHDMRNLSHYSYFVIDLKALKDTENEIIEAITAFKAMYDSRIIIFAEGLKREDEIISRLIEEKIYNIIISKEIQEIKDEILKCSSNIGKTEKDWNIKDIHENQYTFNYKNIKIAVAGVSSRVGTTTTAFNMARFLFNIGAKVSYTEANDSGHLKEIAAYYEFLKVENYYRYKGVEYYPNKQFPNDVNYQIFDLGSLNKGNIVIFKSCNIKILCSGSKPYELIETYETTNSVKDFNYNILFTSVSNEENFKIRKSFENSNDNIHFLKYSPSLFDGKINEDIYKEIINAFIT